MDLSIILLLLSGFFSGFILAILWEITTYKIGHLAHQKGFHFHHSLFGVIAIILIPIFCNDFNKTFFVLLFGIGIITQHSIKEGFIFITKDQD